MPDRWRIVFSHFWFKCFGTMGFTALFFGAYVHLLHHPAYPVTVMPETVVDHWIGVNPLALPVYLSLWVYVSLPPVLMSTRGAIAAYGLRIGLMCLTGLAIFYFLPTATPPANIDWARFPGMGFLKGVDAAGNACPSLHVATAVFTAFAIDRQVETFDLGRGTRGFNIAWCAAIMYSTVATRQHVFVDVVAGAILGGGFAVLLLASGSRRPAFARLTG